MSSKRRRIFTPIALLLVVSTFQLYVGTGFAAAETLSARTGIVRTSPGQQPMGSLTTQGNQPITVNGVSAVSGATVLSGAEIVTPAGVGATVNLGALGSLKIDPNTKLTLTFQDGSVKVVLHQGCAVLTATPGTAGEIDTTKDVKRTDTSNGGEISVCSSGAPGTPSGTSGTLPTLNNWGVFALGLAATGAIIFIVAASRDSTLQFGGVNPSVALP